MREQVIRMLSEQATPVPGVGEQVVSEVKDAVDTARETAHAVAGQLPSFLTHLLISLLVIAGGMVLIRLGKMLIARIIRARKGGKGEQHRTETTRSVTSSIFSYVMFFILAASVLTIFGVDVPSIFAAVGVVGIAVSFGAQTLVKDIISGLFLWGEGNLSVGDLVNINDMTGTVEAVTIRTTTLRNWNGNIHVIPNGDIRTITNMSRGFKRALVNIPCPYEENQERLVAMIREEMEIAGREIEGIESTPDVMSIISFENNCVMVQIAAPCPVGEHWRIERDIRRRVKARFDREGIVMPHYTVPAK